MQGEDINIGVVREVKEVTGVCISLWRIIYAQ
jgi:hypothetical protein